VKLRHGARMTTASPERSGILGLPRHLSVSCAWREKQHQMMNRDPSYEHGLHPRRSAAWPCSGSVGRCNLTLTTPISKRTLSGHPPILSFQPSPLLLPVLPRILVFFFFLVITLLVLLVLIKVAVLLVLLVFVVALHHTSTLNRQLQHPMFFTC
jgi:hypothetical protein